MALLHFSCSNDPKIKSPLKIESNTAVVQVKEVKAKQEPVNVVVSDSTSYTLEILDEKSYWDTTLYEGNLKLKTLKKSPYNLVLFNVAVSNMVESLIDQQLDYGYKKLLEWYENEGMSKSLEKDRQFRKIYSDGNGLFVIYDKYKIDYEYAEIAVLTIWRENEFVFTYSEQTKLGVKIEISGIKESQNSLDLYGNLKGNPELIYGGDFIIQFSKGNRKAAYSYFETNN